MTSELVGSPSPPPSADLLTEILTSLPDGFALLHRPQSERDAQVDVLIGERVEVDHLADVAALRSASACTAARHDVLVMLPYRQVVERGFDHHDDGVRPLVLSIARQSACPLADVVRQLPDEALHLKDAKFDIDDDTYAAIVQDVIDKEIGSGVGANFVIRRSFIAEISDYSIRSALAWFRRLLLGESGVYWTFVVHLGGRTFVGATPERHVTVDKGTVALNPISGTYRYPASGRSLQGALSFLADQKETGELLMVVDEELKMMGALCDGGGHVVGPRLREMDRLAHTEYEIVGRTALPVLDVLSKTLFAPTVTGSPIESACRVIRRYEPFGRGFYGGVVALIGTDRGGMATLDSAILIRTADIDAGGRVSVGVGATLVRNSDAVLEVAETRAKAATILAAAGDRTPNESKLAAAPTLLGHPKIQQLLGRRNAHLAGFWLAPIGQRPLVTAGVPRGANAVVIDAEDSFTAMLAHQLRCLGMTVTIRDYALAQPFEGFDLVVLGPGPGDPTADDDPRIATLRHLTSQLLESDTPFLSVCLSHQILCSLLGLEIRRLGIPRQGDQRTIDLFGQSQRVGFYNTFVANANADRLAVVGLSQVEVSRDRSSGDVHALRSTTFSSVQFHPESLLTENGIEILALLTEGLLTTSTICHRTRRRQHRTPAIPSRTTQTEEKDVTTTVA
jgi:phenazine biosynthesis protein phzE